VGAKEVVGAPGVAVVALDEDGAWGLTDGGKVATVGVTGATGARVVVGEKVDVAFVVFVVFVAFLLGAALGANVFVRFVELVELVGTIVGANDVAFVVAFFSALVGLFVGRAATAVFLVGRAYTVLWLKLMSSSQTKRCDLRNTFQLPVRIVCFVIDCLLALRTFLL
jgi:hypothetical protein